MSILDRIPAAWLAIGLFCVTLSVTQYVAFQIYSIDLQNDYNILESEARILHDNLEYALNQVATSTAILGYFVENRLIGAHFDSVSHDLLKKNRFLDALQIVEGRTIVNTYPLEGNEMVVGWSPLDNPTHRAEAEKAYSRGELYFEGPFRLRQGWIGFVGRQPIFRDGGLWGFSAALIRLETFLMAMGLDSTGRSEQFLYQLAKIDSTGTLQSTLFNHDELMSGGITFSLPIPSGDWILTVKIIHPTHWKQAVPFSILGLLLSLLLGAFAYNLARQPARLRQMVNEKTRELRITKNEIEQFTFVSSHELQEPLRIILSHIKLIRDKHSTRLDEKALKHLLFAIESAERMNRIILDIMRFTKAGHEDETIQAIDMNDMITYLRRLYRKTIDQKKGQLQLTSTCAITTKRSALTQVLECLVGNALTYTRDNIPPIVVLSVDESDAFWTINVEDNGTGVASEHVETMFNLFTRVDSKGRAGTGIGLAVAQKIVEHLGGSIWVESTPGVGSRFRFTLPKPVQADF